MNSVNSGLLLTIAAEDLLAGARSCVTRLPRATQDCLLQALRSVARHNASTGGVDWLALLTPGLARALDMPSALNNIRCTPEALNNAPHGTVVMYLRGAAPLLQQDPVLGDAFWEVLFRGVATLEAAVGMFSQLEAATPVGEEGLLELCLASTGLQTLHHQVLQSPPPPGAALELFDSLSDRMREALRFTFLQVLCCRIGSDTIRWTCGAAVGEGPPRLVWGVHLDAPGQWRGRCPPLCGPDTGAVRGLRWHNLPREGKGV